MDVLVTALRAIWSTLTSIRSCEEGIPYESVSQLEIIPAVCARDLTLGKAVQCRRIQPLLPRKPSFYIVQGSLAGPGFR